MSIVKSHLDEKNFSNAYLLYGQEAFLRKFYKNALKDALVTPGDNLNYSYFTGPETDPDEVAGLLETMPFMADHRVVIVENTGWFAKASKASDDGEEASDVPDDKAAGSGKTAKLVDAIKGMGSDVIAIFVEEKADKKTRLYKAVAAKGACEEYAEQTDDMIIRWLCGSAKSYGKRMDQRTASYLMDESGKDMTALSHEMEKLAAYALDRDSITIEDVDAVCAHQINNKIFDMVTAITRNRQEEALRLYYDLITLRESPFHIIALLIRQYNQLLTLRDGLANGLDLATLASKMGTQDWILKKMVPAAKEISTKRLKQSLELCCNSDWDIKQGNLADSLSAELLIIELSKQKS